MSRICEICGKKTQVGNTRSHAMNANKRKFLVNLQKVTLKTSGIRFKARLCTQCIRTLNKTYKLRKIDLKKLENK